MAKEKETSKESTKTNLFDYNEESIRSLDWKEHIRMRPGMYIGKLGDGSSPDDGIYVLVKEVIDNCIDEFAMGYGKTVELVVEGKQVTIRDYGRGIPLGKVVDVVSKVNTGAKFDSKVFQKSVGLNGVGTKAVNALSNYFKVTAVREGKEKTAEFERGFLIKEYKETKTSEQNGTLVTFIPDDTVFKNFKFHPEFLENQIWNYCFLNAGLKIIFNGKSYVSKNGLLDLLERKTNADEIRYPIIHLKGDDIELAITHNNDYGEDIYSFVNGQHTTQGGTHQQAFREAYVKTLRDFYKKDYDAADIRTGIVAAVAVRVVEPVFESQTKTKLGSTTVRRKNTTRDRINSLSHVNAPPFLEVEVLQGLGRTPEERCGGLPGAPALCVRIALGRPGRSKMALRAQAVERALGGRKLRQRCRPPSLARGARGRGRAARSRAPRDSRRGRRESTVRGVPAPPRGSAHRGADGSGRVAAPPVRRRRRSRSRGTARTPA